MKTNDEPSESLNIIFLRGDVLDFKGIDADQKEFLEFKYVENGYEELDEDKLPVLLNFKYQAIADAVRILEGAERIRDTFLGFRKILYSV